jgi:hypothetical protein
MSTKSVGSNPILPDQPKGSLGFFLT